MVITSSMQFEMTGLQFMQELCVSFEWGEWQVYSITLHVQKWGAIVLGAFSMGKIWCMVLSAQHLSRVIRQLDFIAVAKHGDFYQTISPDVAAVAPDIPGNERNTLRPCVRNFLWDIQP